MSSAASPAPAPRPPATRRRPRLRRAAGAAPAAAPGGFLHLSLLASLRRRPSLAAHAQLLLLGLPLPAHAASRLLRPHLRSGNHLASLRLFLRILRDRDRQPPPRDSRERETIPNSHTLSAALAACSLQASPSAGLSTHAFLVKSGYASDLFAANSLLHFYASFGLPSLARRLFDEMPVRDTVSFNTLIDSYVKSCCIQNAFGVFRIMVDRGLRPDGWTITALSGASAGLKDLRVAKALHGVARRVLQTEALRSQEVAIGLVDMYVQCRGVALARKVFDLAGEKARDVRLWSKMVSGYAMSGEVKMARNLFNDMPKKDVVAWTALIGGYVQAEWYREAFVLFEEMEEAGFEADQVTVVTLLSACVKCGAIDVAKKLHHRVSHTGAICRDARLATSFVDMYARHGCIETAMDVFYGISDKFKTVALFNAMINGLAYARFGEKAIALFDEMRSLGLHPDKITFMAVMCACNRSGLVSRGIAIFDSMVDKYGVERDIKHYACMADLLARDGRLDDAYHFIQNMPFKANIVVWSSLLRASRIQGNFNIGKLAEEQLIQLDPSCKPENLLLSNLFADGKRKKMAARVIKARNHKPEHKHTKCSYIEWNGKVHQFWTTTDTSHPQAKEIRASRIQGNFNIGKLAEEQLIQLDPSCKPENLLLSDLFANGKRKKMAARVIKARNHKPEHKHTKCSYIEWNGKVHQFGTTTDTSHPQAKEIRASRIQGNFNIGKLAEEQLIQLDPSCKPENLLLSDLFANGKRKKMAARVIKARNHKPEHLLLSDLFANGKRKKMAARVIKARNHKPEHRHTKCS